MDPSSSVPWKKKGKAEAETTRRAKRMKNLMFEFWLVSSLQMKLRTLET